MVSGYDNTFGMVVNFGKMFIILIGQQENFPQKKPPTNSYPQKNPRPRKNP